jgi:hypothetical protein
MGTGTFRMDAVTTDMLRLPVRNGDRFLKRNKLPCAARQRGFQRRAKNLNFRL